MAYTPENNPYIPGDPYSYDLKWMVSEIDKWKLAEEGLDHVTEEADRAKDEADRAKDEADRASDKANDAAGSASDAHDSELAAKDYADHIADPVSGLVTDWLADHITQPTTPAIDTSLTVAGAAADAKATGDAIYPFYYKNEVASSPDASVITGNYINFMGGAISPDASYDYIEVPVSAGMKFMYRINFASPTTVGIAFYDANNSYISGVDGYSTPDVVFTAPVNSAVMRASIHTGQLNELLSADISIDIMKKIQSYSGLEKLDLYPADYELQTLSFSQTDTFWDTGSHQWNPFTGINSTDYIDIHNYTGYKFKGRGLASGCGAVLFDVNKNWIQEIAHSNTIAEYEAVFPENAYYMCCSIVLPPYADYIPRLMLANDLVVDKKFKDKKWIVFGDSLSLPAPDIQKEISYSDFISNATGIQTYDMAESGTGYFYSAGHSFGERIGNIPSDYDVITIFGSGNDVKDGLYPLGNVTDNTTATICGNINITIDTLYATDPSIKLGIITPTPWMNFPPTTPSNRMDAYADAIVEICRLRGIPCLDLYHCSGMRPWDATYRALAFDNIGVHPNTFGHRVIASHVKQFLEKLIIQD